MNTQQNTNRIANTVVTGLKSLPWRTLMVLFVGGLLLMGAVGCSDEDEPDPDECSAAGGEIVCMDDEGAICENDDPECTCECVLPDGCTADADCEGDLVCNESGACVAGEIPCTSDDDCDGGICNADGACEAPPSYRFVMVEDMQAGAGGDYPGADVDSVELIKADGTAIGAVTVEDFENTSTGNLASDPLQVLGAPDADCVANSGLFYAMGGEGNWMVLGYGEAIIEEGDSISIVELGSTECGEFDDDDWAVGVSISSDDGTFTELGTGSGSGTVLVSALP